MKRFICAVILLFSTASYAQFVPDPASVQREGPAYRYPQAGWIVLHIEGDPYERGVQHGKLLAPEIADYVNAYATILSPKSPADGWKMTRRMVDALFTRRFDPELLEEMKGIADGASAAGATFDGRALDLTDIVAINAWPEIDSLDDALRATPNGMEGAHGQDEGQKTPASKPSRCSAFAATGPATKDGKPIIGHITMFDLYPCNFYNVWIDIKPTKGHRVVLQGAPGSVQSGMDWYQNDAGIVLVETTIDQTKFNADGMSVGSRSRHAMQYGDSIDAVVNELSHDNNGLYTNEWLLADMHTNEIAMFELGTKTSKLYRSSKHEWFGGTEGFYWGCNNTKSQQVKLETIPSTHDRPADVTFCATDRDIAWVKLYEQYKGKMDASFGKIAYSKPPLVSRHSCDAKYTTADLALSMKANAIFGDPYGQLWEPSAEEREKYPNVKPIVSNPWTVLTTAAPAKNDPSVAVDLQSAKADSAGDKGDDDDKPESPPAWHGTILPQSDGDLWLASSFAKFNDVVSHSRDLQKSAGESGAISPDDCDALACDLFEFRSAALCAAPIAPTQLKFDPADDLPMRSATARGVLMLSELRRRISAADFDAAMDAFGLAHAGKTVRTTEFVDAMQAAHPDLKNFFHCWLDTTDPLPTLALSNVACEASNDGFVITGKITSQGGCAPANVDVTIENANGEKTAVVELDGEASSFKIESDSQPTRVVVNKYGLTPIANGLRWTTLSYMHDLDQTLIVYGTHDDAVGNRIAAEALQKRIISEWEHEKLPIKSDAECSNDDLRGHHLLLIGAPATNSIAARFASALPVTFAAHSFNISGKTYANMDSAVIVAGENPDDKSRSIVCIAGLDAGSTYRAALSATGWRVSAPVRILAARRGTHDIVPAPPDLVHEFK